MRKKGCFGSPFSHVLRFHNSFLCISNFTDIFITVQKIISWKAGESEVICLHGGLRLCRPCWADAPVVRDIESGRGDIKDKKRQSSYAVKSSIHAVGVKNILIFPIHEVKHF